MSKTITNSNYTEDWLPLKNISNGFMITEDGYYISGVKVIPRNIFILDQGAQNNVLVHLANYYNTIDYEFWLLVADRPVDLDVYLSKLLSLYNQETDGARRKLIQQDIDKANQFTGITYNIVDTEFYLLFKDKKMEVVQKRIANAIAGLSSCGLQSMQIVNNDIRMILDNFLNDGNSTLFRGVM